MSSAETAYAFRQALLRDVRGPRSLRMFGSACFSIMRVCDPIP